jgi:amino acid transporter
MIAIGGAVGSGLIIGSGSALSKAGPVGLLIGYSLVGLICFTVMTALGEASARTNAFSFSVLTSPFA